MDEAQAWHQEAIDRGMGQTLRELCERMIAPRFYLAGGTALALQLGHRRSVDLDFFSAEHFEAETLVQKLQVMPAFSLASMSESTVHTTIGKTKVSFFGYVYPVLFPFKTFLGANLADPRDIACMKINAIARRGTKRDFVDLYVMAKRYRLSELMTWFKMKYVNVNHNMVHIVKSLVYFDDADREPMPNMLVRIDWQEVKRFFAREARSI